MSAALLDLPPHLRRKLASALETGLLAAPFSRVSLLSALGTDEPPEGVLAALEAWERLGVPARAKAAWLRSLEAAERRREAPEFVWSGPKVPGVASRPTREAFDRALGSVRASVWLSTYAFFDGPRAFEPLAKRMEEVPGLAVTLLLNIERTQTDTTRVDDLVLRFAERLWSNEWPGKRRPRVFYDPRSLNPDGAKGVLHAKVLVTDEERVLVTSANLTERALRDNIEVGVLLRDPVFARTLIAHFRSLIERQELHALPSS